jgi:hypothetical protein
MSCPVLHYIVLPYPVLSSSVLSCLIMPCPAPACLCPVPDRSCTICPALSCLFACTALSSLAPHPFRLCPMLPCPVLTCPVLSIFLSCPVPSYSVLSIVLSFPVSSYPVLPYAVVSCQTLSCPFLRLFCPLSIAPSYQHYDSALNPPDSRCPYFILS